MKGVRNTTAGVFLFLSFLMLIACNGNKKEKIAKLVQEWQGKEIVFPPNPVFTTLSSDTIDFHVPESKYKVVVYVDSFGCISCKLQLEKWKGFIAYTDSLTNRQVPFLFFFHPKNEKELKYIFRRDKFDYPVCIDLDDQLNRLNQFPAEMNFQTFLLDKNNKVLVIGNPVHNLAIKDLYINQLTETSLPDAKSKMTTVETNVPEIDLGTFKNSETREATFILKNTGNYPLVIIDASTTCGCASVSFDKNPAQTNETLQLHVAMTPKEAGSFNETITVKCNTGNFVKLQIKGKAL